MVFALLGIDHRGRESTLPREPVFDVGARGMYRPIIPSISPALHHILSLGGLRSAFGAETGLVNVFKVETNPSRNQVSSAAHRDMKRKAMTLFYDFIRLRITVWVHISTLLSVNLIQET